MPIKAIILDVSGTLIDEVSRTVAPGISAMLHRLRAHNISLFAISNKQSSINLARSLLGFGTDRILTRQMVGGAKGTRKFVGAVCSRLGISSNELLYLGDTDQDHHEAVNSDVAFFLAKWATPTPTLQYGIQVDSPDQFAQIVETFFLKQTLWYYSINSQDRLNRPVVVRALLDPDMSKQTGITALLKYKDRNTMSKSKQQELAWFLSMHLLASLYLEGLHLQDGTGGSIWCLYPGHEDKQTGVLDEFAVMVSQLFHDRYAQDLILRHTPAVKSAYARAQGVPLPIDNQLQTIRLNEAHREKIEGRRILVIDDFTTRAHGFETARNFLFNAGATGVVSIAVGKYPAAYYARSQKDGVEWDSFVKATLTQNDFNNEQMVHTYDDNALSYFDVPYSGSIPASTPRARTANLLAQAIQQWEPIIEGCRKITPKLAALLRSTHPLSVELGNPPTLIILAEYDFHAKKLDEPVSRTMIVQVVEEILGKPVHIKVQGPSDQ